MKILQSAGLYTLPAMAATMALAYSKAGPCFDWAARCDAAAVLPLASSFSPVEVAVHHALSWQFTVATKLLPTFNRMARWALGVYNMPDGWRARQQACAVLQVSWIGIFRRLPKEQLRGAYLALSRKYHPDKHPNVSADESKRLTHCFRTLKPSVMILQDPNDPLYPIGQVDMAAAEIQFGNMQKAQDWTFGGAYFLFCALLEISKVYCASVSCASVCASP